MCQIRENYSDSVAQNFLKFLNIAWIAQNVLSRSWKPGGFPGHGKRPQQAQTKTVDHNKCKKSRNVRGMNVKDWGTTKNEKIKHWKFWKKVYPLSKVSPQARTEGRKDPVVLQWDPWEGHLQVTDSKIVAVNLVVVVVFMVVVVDVVVGRALAGDQQYNCCCQPCRCHRVHGCCRWCCPGKDTCR